MSEEPTTRWTSDRGRLVANVGARVGALAALGIATILVARAGGPDDVGLFALLRVLPGLVGVAVSCGLPTAVPYFISGRGDGTTRATIVALTIVCAVVAAALWVVGSPVLQRVFFREQGLLLVACCAVPVLTQQLVAVGKSLLQGGDDLEAANIAIFAEESSFLPAYLVVMPFFGGAPRLIVALVLADVVVAAGIWMRLHRKKQLGRGFQPDVRLGKEILVYGVRGQVGGMLLLLNLRLDFALLGALAGPAVLGIYAIASKYAELLRLPGLAITYVLYPKFTRQGAGVASARTSRLLPRATLLTALAAIPLALVARPVLPLLYGHEFASAVVPAWILIGGLVTEGAAGLITAYLYATRRPGLNSLAIGAGVVVTAVLDVLLIPRHAAVGAAIASTVAYLFTTVVLLALFAALRNRPVDGEAATVSDAGRDRAAGPRGATISLEPS